MKESWRLEVVHPFCIIQYIHLIQIKEVKQESTW
jgi:hypothetical protein